MLLFVVATLRSASAVDPVRKPGGGREAGLTPGISDKIDVGNVVTRRRVAAAYSRKRGADQLSKCSAE